MQQCQTSTREVDYSLLEVFHIQVRRIALSAFRLGETGFFREDFDVRFRAEVLEMSNKLSISSTGIRSFFAMS